MSLEPGSPEWQGLVTASKVAPILGISPFSDQYTVWHQMAGNLPPIAVTEPMRRGKIYEASLLNDFYGRHPELTREDLATVRADTWLAVSPDSLAHTDSGRTLLVEAKTTAGWDGWGEPETDQIPEHYRAQVVVCAHVLGCDEIVFPVMGPYWDYREYWVDPDPELAEAILAKCHEFWLSVQSGIEPELSETVASYTTWTKVADPFGTGAVEIPPELARRFLIAAAGEKDFKPAKAAIANYLEKAGAKYAVCQGHKILTRQKSKDGASLVIARKPPDPTIFEDAA